MIDKTQAERIATATNGYRPDWPVAQIMGVLAQVAARPYRDIAVAITWLACDYETRSPARLTDSGPWWRASVLASPEDNRAGSINRPVAEVLALAAGNGNCDHGEPRGPDHCAICRRAKGLVANQGHRRDDLDLGDNA